jgi:hypothetical protein
MAKSQFAKYNEAPGVDGYWHGLMDDGGWMEYKGR